MLLKKKKITIQSIIYAPVGVVTNKEFQNEIIKLLSNRICWSQDQQRQRGLSDKNYKREQPFIVQ
jgi:hypothetical protein